jgi:aryl-alcohol dehydrogenase-like predicted oxidoreductase
MGNNTDVPLILGGHSFFSDLGNEPAPTPDGCRDIVSACLDAGITWFDTTHQPERLALGRALSELDRRDEATIFAWNFMQVLGPRDKLDRPVEFESRHLEQLCGELQTNAIDCLVLHDLDGGTPEKHARQESLALEWLKAGHVKALGVWAPGKDAPERYGGNPAFRFMIRPLNVKTTGATESFAMTKALGWQNYACSPFVRGWELDKLVAEALEKYDGDEPTLRAKLADLMLRFSLFHANVDRLITAIRRIEWIQPNIASCRRGPLTEDEAAWLSALTGSMAQ